MPTLWYTVHLSSPPGGVQADNTASINGPGLSIDSMRMFTDSDTALVEANSEAEAIQIALTGSLEIGVSELELPATTYTFSSSTSSTSASAQAAYLISPTGGNTWQVALEDTAAYPTISDWDYNDFTWNLTVDGSTSLPPNYTAPYSPPPPPPYVPPDPYMGPYQYAVPDSATTDRDTPVTIPVIANDIQPTNGSSLSVGYASNGMYGTVTVAADGQSVIYTPNAGFTGMDSFYYVLAGSGDMATVYVTVEGDPPLDETAPLPATASLASNATVVVVQPTSSSLASFTLFRESGANDQPLTATYEARLDDGQLPFVVGSATIATNQDEVTISILIPSDPAFDQATHTLTLLLTDSAHSDILGGRSVSATTLLVPAELIPNNECNCGDGELTAAQKSLLFGLGNEKPDPSGKVNNTPLPKQGPMDDCWFVAGAISAARVDPDAIVKMFSYDTDNEKWVIKFQNTKLPAVAIKYDPNFGGVSNDNGIWIQLLEQGFAKLKDFEKYYQGDTDPKTGAETLKHFGTLFQAYPYLVPARPNSGGRITMEMFPQPKPSALYTNSPPGLKALRTQLGTVADGGFVMFRSSEQPVSAGMVKTHFYAVIGFDKDKDEVELQNPHGTAGPRGGVFKVKISDANFWADFNYIGYESSAVKKK